MTPLADLAESLSTALPFGLDLLLRATIILAIVQLLLVALKRRSAATRHVVVTLGLAAVIALPLLMEYRCFPDPTALGLNAFDVNLAINTSTRPSFFVCG